MKKDYFAAKAGTYEQTQSRVDNVTSIPDAIREQIRLDRSMHIVDFGSGTGLLLERIAPYVGKITAVDVSAAMNAELRAKLGRLPCELEILPVDLERADIELQFDGIVSSMTMHHMEKRRGDVRQIPPEAQARRLHRDCGSGPRGRHVS